MRAEIESIVSDITRSLDLLAQRMNWSTAPHRLEEFNAMSEDPKLWDDPEKAQKLMRERQALLDAMANYTALKQELTDNIDLIELGEAEDDAEVVTEAETALKALKKVADQKEIEALLNGEMDSADTFLWSIRVRVAPKAVTGRRCWRGCMCVGRKSRVTRWN